MKRLLDRVASPRPASTATAVAATSVVAPGGRVDGGSAAASDISIEVMKRRHLRQVLPIEQQSYPRPWTLGIFQGELDGVRDGHRFYIVAKSRGEVVGYGGLLFALEDAHVTNIAVDPRRQRQGIGRVLMGALARAAIARGSINLSLEVRVSNKAAQELYRQFGFVPAGVRPRYYENVEDAIIMWCHDINTPEYLARLTDLSTPR